MAADVTRVLILRERVTLNVEATAIFLLLKFTLNTCYLLTYLFTYSTGACC